MKPFNLFDQCTNMPLFVMKKRATNYSSLVASM